MDIIRVWMRNRSQEPSIGSPSSFILLNYDSGFDGMVDWNQPQYRCADRSKCRACGATRIGFRSASNPVTLPVHLKTIIEP
ncbi:MAG TPA: hypothetical protein DCG12_08105 [Planctomycetaceae bacterium]|nr:hypothetical protein [Planctomycetaceae bacterium]